MLYLDCLACTWAACTSQLLAGATAESAVVLDVAVVRLQGRLTLRHAVLTRATLTCNNAPSRTRLDDVVAS